MLVDLQVNGWAGIDFSEPGLHADDVATATIAIRSAGTHGFLATLVTAADDTYRRNLAVIAQAARTAPCRGHLLGVHLEGPFISRETGYVGAHDATLARDPDPEALARWQEAADGLVRLVTIAPELPGAEAFIARARSLGIAVSLGHSRANAADLARAATAGACALTHLGNGVPHQLNRHVNPIWDGLAEERLAMMVIADGHHVPFPTLRTMIRAKGVARTILVSDAAPAAGLPPGRHRVLGHDALLEPDGRLSDPATGYLVGSGSSLAQGVERLRSAGIATDADLARMACDQPLALIGLTRAAVDASDERRARA